MKTSKETKIDLQKQKLTSLPTTLFRSSLCYENIKTADLSQNDIIELPRQFFSLFCNLEIFYLQYNKLIILHDEIGQLTKLRLLRLDNNCLSFLPNSIGQLSSLSIFSVSENKLASIPSTIGNLKNTLTVLNLSENQIKFLPQEIGELTNLEDLNIYHNRIVSIPTSLCKLEKLEVFKLEWLRFLQPPLPVQLKGASFFQLRDELWQLCKQLASKSMKQCSFSAFFMFFSEGELLINQYLKDTGKITKKYVGKTMFQIAVLENDIGMIDIFFPLHPDFNILDNDGCSALGLAIKERNNQMVKKLLDITDNILYNDVTSASLIHMAILANDVQLIKKLLERGVDPGLLDANGNSPMHLLFTDFDNSPAKAGEIAKILLDAGLYPNILNENKYGVVHIAAEKNQLQGIRWIISYNRESLLDGNKGFDLDLQGGENMITALHIASCKGYYYIVQELIMANANVDIKNAEGETPRMVRRGSAVISKMIRKAENKNISSKLFNKPGTEGGLMTERKLFPQDIRRKKEINPKKSNKTKNTQYLKYQIIKTRQKASKLIFLIKNDETKMYEKYAALNYFFWNKEKETNAIHYMSGLLGNLNNQGLKIDLIYWLANIGTVSIRRTLAEIKINGIPQHSLRKEIIYGRQTIKELEFIGDYNNENIINHCKIIEEKPQVYRRSIYFN